MSDDYDAAKDAYKSWQLAIEEMRKRHEKREGEGSMIQHPTTGMKVRFVGPGSYVPGGNRTDILKDGQVYTIAGSHPRGLMIGLTLEGFDDEFYATDFERDE